jgi:hypothetical protein
MTKKHDDFLGKTDKHMEGLRDIKILRKGQRNITIHME